MHTAHTLHSVLITLLQALARWCKAAPASAASSTQETPEKRANFPLSMRPESIKHPKTMPLRVVRVLDAETQRSGAGRIRISGCMADVCAELDRLAAREAAQLS